MKNLPLTPTPSLKGRGSIHLAACITAVFLSGALLAQGNLRVEKARFRPFQVAVTGAPELASIVMNDLELSGVFRASMAAIAEGRVEIQQKDKQIIVKANQKTFKYPSKISRELAHQISNDVYQFFTGEPGFFNSKIVASKMTPEGKQIVLMDFDGHNPRELTSGPGINILPTISPNGKEILFTSYKHKNPDLFSIKSDGTDLKVISKRSGLNMGAVFAPNGAQIALTLSYEGKSDVYSMKPDGSDLKRLSSGYGLNTSPSFSPDGSQIAFVSNRSGNPQIYTMNSDGSAVKRLTFQGKYNQSPQWSPAGDLIAFTGRDEHNVFDVFLFDLASGNISRVTQEQGKNDESSFSPNGKMLVFSSTRNGKRDLFVSNLDGTFQKQITQGGDYWTPRWGK